MTTVKFRDLATLSPPVEAGAVVAMQDSKPPALSEKTISIVKATAPVLQEHGETLTRHFYQRMFRENPEVSPLFNPAHQAGGSQQRALAGAICAFAANVDQLEVLGAAVETIAQKHAALRILPEHYPIVGENLLASIREVLGDAATEDIVGAWAEAYGFLAAILIGREKQIYKEQARADHGWNGFREFRIDRKVTESEAIVSLYLRPSDGGGVPAYKPGQYLTVRVPDGRGSTTMRNYSLSEAPRGDRFRISVKSEPGGMVSGLLHDLPEGSGIEVAPPCGDFFLDPSEHHERPLVLLSAGVGITPVLAMLETVLREQPERQVVFIHGALNSRVHAFGDSVRKLRETHPRLVVHVRYSEPGVDDLLAGRCDSTGFIDAELIESLVPRRDCDYYFCGPKPFMSAIYRQLLAWGIPGSQVHFEFFGPRQELEAATA